jgi:flagellin-like protein
MRNTKKRGVSPVIATVILVAIAIVISIAAAFWMTGLLSSFTAYEKLTLSAIISKSGSDHKVTIAITNDGTVTATVLKILIDGEDKTSSFSPTIPSSGYDISAGESVVFTATITGGLSPAGKPHTIIVVTLRGSYETQVIAP